MKKYYFIILIILLFSPLISKAAILYLSPERGEYHLDEVFIVELEMDTEGEYINTVQADLNFSLDILEIQDLSEGNSILSLWVEKPNFSNNKISFIGGIPGGYQGPDGLIGKIIFRVKETSKNYAQVVFGKTSKVLLNDGKGTEAKLTTRGTIFNILPEKLEIPENQWQKNIAEDKISPQPFKIEISQNPLIFDNKYFITFSTIDKQTGIDHYEVREGNKDWEKATSPYVLKDQNLMSTVWVRAVDKAGNYWIESMELSQKWGLKQITYLVIILLVLVLILIIMRMTRIKTKQSLK